MKTNLLIAITTVFLSAQAFATGTTLNEELSIKLRTALVNSGAEVETRVETSYLSIKQLNCSIDGGFLLMPLKCSFVDVNSTREIEVTGDKAEAIRTALLAAGLKEAHFRQGERSSDWVGANAVSCNTTFFRRSIIACTIL